MYNNKITCLLVCMLLHIVSGQFSFGGSSDSGFSGFKLSGPLGQLMRGSSPLNLMTSNYGFGQILGSLINSGSNSGGPLSQLATAASSQYINALRSNPLLSQFANVAAGQQSGPPSAASPYAAPPSHQPHSPHHHSMYQNPMALLGGDSSMYGPPQQPGYDHHFGGSNVFPQFATPDSKSLFFVSSTITIPRSFS